MNYFICGALNYEEMNVNKVNKIPDEILRNFEYLTLLICSIPHDLHFNPTAEKKALLIN